MSRRIIYDLGANNGDNIPYYLLKAERVIAVEANPTLCAQITERFADQITNGQLVLVNAVLHVGQPCETIAFYIHQTNHVFSQLPKPEHMGGFIKMQLPALTVTDLIERYGDPYYIKIDIEHYDHVLLRALFAAGIRPPYLSAESHHVAVLRAFKLLDSGFVADHYREHIITTLHGLRPYSFPYHSAGPFGEDIDGPWLNGNQLFTALAAKGLGWRDIHVSRVDEPAVPDPA